MLDGFICNLNPARIVFGRGKRSALASEIVRAGGTRAVVLSTAFQASDAQTLMDDLGELAVGLFTEATMHTPVAVTEQALAVFRDKGADCVVALGGGSTVGLGKAIALRTDCPQIVMATTYAGSEVTPILGQTKEGTKSTLRDHRVLPETVIYDPDLTVGLPVGMSVTSGLNAMAHAIEGVYSQEQNPIAAMMAVEGVRAMRNALPAIAVEPNDIEARTRALYGAWLCGTVLGSVGMALHHKLCHTLGGSFDLPHAETHAILLPHTAAFNADAAQKALEPIAALFDGEIGGGLWDFAKALGAPLALKKIGLDAGDLDRAAELAVKNPYWNPRPVDHGAVRALLQHAWEGVRPE